MICFGDYPFSVDHFSIIFHLRFVLVFVVHYRQPRGRFAEYVT